MYKHLCKCDKEPRNRQTENDTLLQTIIYNLRTKILPHKSIDHNHYYSMHLCWFCRWKMKEEKRGKKNTLSSSSSSSPSSLPSFTSLYNTIIIVVRSIRRYKSFYMRWIKFSVQCNDFMAMHCIALHWWWCVEYYCNAWNNRF